MEVHERGAKRLVLEAGRPLAGNHDGVAVAFYDRLFEIDAGARSLFARANMVAQRGKFVQMLGDIVETWTCHGELIPTVSALGRRHVGTGVRDADYDRVREALFAALAAELGAGFTDEVRDAWEEAYALTAALMKRGAQTGVSAPSASS
jgi:hemoglobin-like flavoprotein